MNDDDQPPSILRCPFDGGTPAIDVDPATNAVFVRCTECTASGPRVFVREYSIMGEPRECIDLATTEAVRVWNERPDEGFLHHVPEVTKE